MIVTSTSLNSDWLSLITRVISHMICSVQIMWLVNVHYHSRLYKRSCFVDSSAAIFTPSVFLFFLSSVCLSLIYSRLRALVLNSLITQREPRTRQYPYCTSYRVREKHNNSKEIPVNYNENFKIQISRLLKRKPLF